jgi:acetylglutamate kinase
MENLTLVKAGGKIVEEEETLRRFLHDFKAIRGYKALAHGGGRLATRLAARLGLENIMQAGRRITDREMLNVAIMVYGGLVNKNITAGLQALGVNALGLTGADMNVIRSEKRPVKDVDYGYAGDIKEVKAGVLAALIEGGIVPVLAPLTHDGQGLMLNTNADTLAAETAKALAKYFDVTLLFCFEKQGVLADEADNGSLIAELDYAGYRHYVARKVIQGGMIPKLDNAFAALDAGVKEVIITHPAGICRGTGTRIRHTKT